VCTHVWMQDPVNDPKLWGEKKAAHAAARERHLKKRRTLKGYIERGTCTAATNNKSRYAWACATMSRTHAHTTSRKHAEVDIGGPCGSRCCAPGWGSATYDDDEDDDDRSVSPFSYLPTTHHINLV